MEQDYRLGFISLRYLKMAQKTVRSSKTPKNDQIVFHTWSMIGVKKNVFCGVFDQNLGP